MSTLFTLDLSQKSESKTIIFCINRVIDLPIFVMIFSLFMYEYKTMTQIIQVTLGLI